MWSQQLERLPRLARLRRQTIGNGRKLKKERDVTLKKSKNFEKSLAIWVTVVHDLKTMLLVWSIGKKDTQKIIVELLKSKVWMLMILILLISCNRKRRTEQVSGSDKSKQWSACTRRDKRQLLAGRHLHHCQSVPRKLQKQMLKKIAKLLRMNCIHLGLQRKNNRILSSLKGLVSHLMKVTMRVKLSWKWWSQYIQVIYTPV
mmetsp:Transcript_3886/g.5648  ORF Transcript_3886/g.5648 Transcript_3886/m.5648 type:complete len:202 (-) Transcript_3886:856-1461(-)